MSGWTETEVTPPVVKHTLDGDGWRASVQRYETGIMIRIEGNSSRLADVTTGTICEVKCPSLSVPEAKQVIEFIIDTLRLKR